MIYQTTSTCFGCGGSDLQVILSLGETPLADRLLTKEDLATEEPIVPLGLVLCRSCALVQLAQTVDPNEVFGPSYPYYSSFSPALREHFEKSALSLIESHKLGSDDLVVELASNDGVMLKPFAEHGIPVLGIDPSSGPAEVARSRGIPTLIEFFDKALADKLREEHQNGARLILANNVLAHVPDLQGFVAGMEALLADNGTIVVEAPYLLNLLDGLEFDTIYHQHICYYSVTALDHLFRRFNLFINDVKPISIHGGSLRVFVEKRENPNKVVKDYLTAEKQRGIGDPDSYQAFVSKVSALQKEVRECVQNLRAQGKSVAAYGAAAKGTTMLAACGLTSKDLDFVVDLNTHKHGLYMSGARLPIVSTETLKAQSPDYLLILAWNFADEIMRQQAEFHDNGGRFIIPVPEVKIV